MKKKDKDELQRLLLFGGIVLLGTAIMFCVLWIPADRDGGRCDGSEGSTSNLSSDWRSFMGRECSSYPGTSESSYTIGHRACARTCGGGNFFYDYSLLGSDTCECGSKQ